MADRRDIRWEGNTFYAEEQISAILKSLGVDVQSETDIVYLAYCPFHGNRDTPSFAVSKTEGLYICYNPSCSRTGNLMRLITTLGDMNDFQAKRLIAKCKHSVDIQEQLQRVTEPVEAFPAYRHMVKRGESFVEDPHYMARVKQDMWKYAEPQLYMKGRGFESQTAEDFQIGYDKDMDMVCVPMHDPMGKTEVGAVRRSLKGKVFKNTPGLPTSKTLFNIHRAKREGDSCVIVEASFSVMKLHQSGYPNGVATLMGHFSQAHASLLSKYFNTITIMTDFDERKFYPSCPRCNRAGLRLCAGHNPGEDLGMKIADLMGHKRVMWAHHGGSTRFPPGIKDPDDMDEETIRHSIKNAITHFEYALDL